MAVSPSVIVMLSVNRITFVFGVVAALIGAASFKRRDLKGARRWANFNECPPLR
jgi:hypothetical protein